MKNTWSDKLLASWSSDRSLRDEIGDIERLYRRSVAVLALMTVAGLVLMMLADARGAGLFLAITGVVNIALMKVWAHVRINTLRVIWEVRGRPEGAASTSGRFDGAPVPDPQPEN